MDDGRTKRQYDSNFTLHIAIALFTCQLMPRYINSSWNIFHSLQETLPHEDARKLFQSNRDRLLKQRVNVETSLASISIRWSYWKWLLGYVCPATLFRVFHIAMNWISSFFCVSHSVNLHSSRCVVFVFCSRLRADCSQVVLFFVLPQIGHRITTERFASCVVNMSMVQVRLVTRLYCCACISDVEREVELFLSYRTSNASRIFVLRELLHFWVVCDSHPNFCANFLSICILYQTSRFQFASRDTRTTLRQLIFRSDLRWKRVSVVTLT